MLQDYLFFFAAPVTAEVEWTEDGAQGQFRFVNRIWRLYNQLLPEFKVFNLYNSYAENTSSDLSFNKSIKELSNANQTILKVFPLIKIN